MITMKTIMVSDETYKKLSTIKGKKSFTVLLAELVDRLKQTNKSDIMKFAGIMSKEDADESLRRISEIRKGAKARI